MSDVRLYGQSGDEYLDRDLQDAVDKIVDDHYDDDDHPEFIEIEEFSTMPASKAFPPVDHVIEWICERASEDEFSFEEFAEAVHDAQTQDVVNAFQAALDLWASKVTGWYVADKVLRVHKIPWPPEGEGWVLRRNHPIAVIEGQEPEWYWLEMPTDGKMRS